MHTTPPQDPHPLLDTNVKKAQSPSNIHQNKQIRRGKVDHVDVGDGARRVCRSGLARVLEVVAAGLRGGGHARGAA
eukprot:247592-Rhodomonas_salina.1